MTPEELIDFAMDADSGHSFSASQVKRLLAHISAQDKEIERLKPVKGRHRHSQDGVSGE